MCILLNHKEKALIDAKNGDLVRPACFDALAQYVSYYTGKYKKADKLQAKLKRIFKGELLLVDMIAEIGENS